MGWLRAGPAAKRACLLSLSQGSVGPQRSWMGRCADESLALYWAFCLPSMPLLNLYHVALLSASFSSLAIALLWEVLTASSRNSKPLLWYYLDLSRFSVVALGRRVCLVSALPHTLGTLTT